jgi:hypothetical protein
MEARQGESPAQAGISAKPTARSPEGDAHPEISNPPVKFRIKAACAEVLCMRVGVIRTGGRLSVRAYAGAIEPRLDRAAVPDSPAGTFGVAPSATRAELRQKDVGWNSHATLRTFKGDGG